LVASGDIRFVTFHQSFSYEDFVEGLRAETDEGGQLRYEIVDGVFKSLCTAAVARVTQQEASPVDLNGRRTWKMSLGNSLGDDAYIFDECIESNCALLGYGGSTDFSDCKDRDDVFKRFTERNESVTRDSYPVSAVNTFLFKMKEGDLLIVSEGNTKFRAIGEVVGPYRRIEREEQSDSYGQCQGVAV
jgi:5-methylcytosine-specific restriction protein B